MLVMRQVILYARVYFTTKLWRVFSVFFMDNFHGKRVDNMHRSKDRVGGFFPTYGNLDSCQRLHVHNLGFTTAREKKELVSS